MRLDYESMRDFQYGEENPGYERELGLTPSDLGWGDPDYDPEVAVLVAENNARDNARRRENNLRADNARLRALLDAHGIEIPEEN